MSTKTMRKINHTRGLARIVLGVAAILAVPFIAMQFTEEVQWTVSDFLSMGLLLFAFGCVYEFAIRGITDGRNRMLATFGLIGVLLIIWIELAVGILD